MSQLLIGFVLCTLTFLSPAADEIANGMYAIKYQGNGRHIKLSDGTEVILAERRGDVQGEASVRSIANDNSRFQVRLKDVSKLDNRAGSSEIALVIDGVCMPCTGQGGYVDGGNEAHDFAFGVSGKAVAEKVAKHLKVDPVYRKHPGYRLKVSWIPDRETYAVGEPISLTMEIENVGDVELSFVVGGQQRGARDNQFRFLAKRDGGKGKPMPDTGDSRHRGGLSTFWRLKPREKLTKSVNVDKWFNFADPDIYHVKGQYELKIYEPFNSAGLTPPIWDDFATGECLIRVVAKNK